MPYILRSLSELDDLNQMMHEYKELNDGYFTLAITPNSAQSILSDLLGGFTIQYPNIKVNLLECEPLDLLPSLFKDKADICLGSMQAQLPFYRSTYYYARSNSRNPSSKLCFKTYD